MPTALDSFATIFPTSYAFSGLLEAAIAINGGTSVPSGNLWCKPCSINGSFSCYRKRQYCMTEIDDGEILRAIKNIYR